MSDRLDQLIGSADIGRRRLIDAHKRLEVASEVIRRVAERHAVAVEILRTAPKPFRTYRHVGLARSHAADALSQAGFKWAQVGRALCTDPVNAKRLAQRWKDHQAGRLATVSEDQAHAVRDLITAGMSEAQACDQVGVGVTRFQSREKIMKMEGKL